MSLCIERERERARERERERERERRERRDLVTEVRERKVGVAAERSISLYTGVT